jgi:nucleoid-associated protein YgaU
MAPKGNDNKPSQSAPKPSSSANDKMADKMKKAYGSKPADSSNDSMEASRAKAKEQMAKLKASKSKVEIIATRTVKESDTLSHIALKYYGHATKPYYMYLYEHNKELIGDNPNHVRPGLELEIPALTDELKD